MKVKYILKTYLIKNVLFDFKKNLLSSPLNFALVKHLSCLLTHYYTDSTQKHSNIM